MKKLLLVTLISFISFTVLSQSCLPEGITFTTQAQIDSFAINYPVCTEIEGDMSIFGSDITNLSGLSILTHLGGNLKIGYVYGYANQNLTSLTGLEGIISIGGDLQILCNDALVSLTGLEGLTSIGGYLGIGNSIPESGNPDLTSLTGLDGLISIGGGLIISGNDALVSLTGLGGLTSIGVGLGIFSNDALTSLTGLEAVTSIGEHLRISGNPALINLSGMENVTSIGGQLEISGNTSLTSLAGLDNIDEGTIDDIYIESNGSLSNCEAIWLCDYLANPVGSVNIYNNALGCNTPADVADDCGITLPCLPYGNYIFLSQDGIDNFQMDYPNCTELKGYTLISGSNINNLLGLSVITTISTITIEDINILDSLTGLDNVTSIEYRLRVHNNDALTSLAGLDNVTSVGDLEIKWNDALTSLTGLEGLTSLGDNLNISFNNALTSLIGLDNVTSIGWLKIGQNPALTSLTGLNNVTSIGGSLEIGFNALTSLSGLESLTSIEVNLEINNNHSLTSLTGLVGLTSIGGQLDIFQNDTLISLSGIDNIDAASISDLSIRYNDLLSTCEVQSVCDYLVSPGGTIEIDNNAPGCNSQQEVEEACASFVNELGTLYGIKTQPNPFTTSTTIEYELKEPEKVTLTIYNQMGKQIYQKQENQLQGTQQLLWNAEGYADGIYYYRLQVGDAVANGKLVKVR